MDLAWNSEDGPRLKKKLFAYIHIFIVARCVLNMFYCCNEPSVTLHYMQAVQDCSAAYC